MTVVKSPPREPPTCDARALVYGNGIREGAGMGWSRKKRTKGIGVQEGQACQTAGA